MPEDRIDLLRRESREYFGRLDAQSREYFERLDVEAREFRKESREYFERRDAEARAFREENREIQRMMIASLEQLTGMILEGRNSLVEMRADIVAQRQGFLSLIDELKRHGLGGPPAAPA